MTSPVPAWEVGSQGLKLLGSFLPGFGAFAGSLGKTQPNKTSLLTAVALEISSDQVSSKVTAAASHQEPSLQTNI